MTYAEHLGHARSLLIAKTGHSRQEITDIYGSSCDVGGIFFIPRSAIAHFSPRCLRVGGLLPLPQ